MGRRVSARTAIRSGSSKPNSTVSSAFTGTSSSISRPLRAHSRLLQHRGQAMTTLPYTGREYLDSLDDGREVWIYGERVKKIAEHPAFRNCARMLARLYD